MVGAYYRARLQAPLVGVACYAFLESHVTSCQAHADEDQAGLAQAGPARIGG